MAWKQIIQPKDLGGLGFKDLSAQATTLLGKWTKRYLEDPNSEWALMYAENLKLIKWKYDGSFRRLGYSL